MRNQRLRLKELRELNNNSSNSKLEDPFQAVSNSNFLSKRLVATTPISLISWILGDHLRSNNLQWLIYNNSNLLWLTYNNSNLKWCNSQHSNNKLSNSPLSSNSSQFSSNNHLVWSNKKSLIFLASSIRSWKTWQTWLRKVKLNQTQILWWELVNSELTCLEWECHLSSVPICHLCKTSLWQECHQWAECQVWIWAWEWTNMEQTWCLLVEWVWDSGQTYQANLEGWIKALRVLEPIWEVEWISMCLIAISPQDQDLRLLTHSKRTVSTF